MTNTPLDSTQETRSRILEAAVNVFASKGYHDTKVDDIVSQSQTSKGSFYFYFPSKQDIFLALVDTFANLLESRLRERLSTEPSGTARVNAALQVCLETFGQYRSLAKIALVQATGLGAAFEQKRQAVNQRFIEIVRENLDGRGRWKHPAAGYGSGGLRLGRRVERDRAALGLYRPARPATVPACAAQVVVAKRRDSRGENPAVGRKLISKCHCETCEVGRGNLVFSSNFSFAGYLRLLRRCAPRNDTKNFRRKFKQ